MSALPTRIEREAGRPLTPLEIFDITVSASASAGERSWKIHRTRRNCAPIDGRSHRQKTETGSRMTVLKQAVRRELPFPFDRRQVDRRAAQLGLGVPRQADKEAIFDHMGLGADTDDGDRSEPRILWLMLKGDTPPPGTQSHAALHALQSSK